MQRHLARATTAECAVWQGGFEHGAACTARRARDHERLNSAADFVRQGDTALHSLQAACNNQAHL